MDFINEQLFFYILDILIFIDPNFYNLINLSLCNKFFKTIIQNYIKTDIIFLKWNNINSTYKRKFDKLWYVFNINQDNIPVMLPITNYGCKNESNYEFRIPKNSNLKNKTLNHTLIINPKKDNFQNIYKSVTLSYKSTTFGSKSINYDPKLFLKCNKNKNKNKTLYFAYWKLQLYIDIDIDTNLFYNNNNFVFIVEIENRVTPIKIIAINNPIVGTYPILDDTIHKKRKRSDLEFQILGVVIKEKLNIHEFLIHEYWKVWTESKLDTRYNNIMPLIKCTLCDTSQLCNKKCIKCKAKFIY